MFENQLVVVVVPTCIKDLVARCKILYVRPLFTVAAAVRRWLQMRLSSYRAYLVPIKFKMMEWQKCSSIVFNRVGWVYKWDSSTAASDSFIGEECVCVYTYDQRKETGSYNTKKSCWVRRGWTRHRRACIHRLALASQSELCLSILGVPTWTEQKYRSHTQKRREWNKEILRENWRWFGNRCFLSCICRSDNNRTGGSSDFLAPTTIIYLP